MTDLGDLARQIFQPKQPKQEETNTLLSILAGLSTPSLMTPIFPPPPPPPPPPIQDRWFKGQTINVDGYVFERCRFDGCVLVTEFATFAFRECFISPNSALYFKGPSLKVARLLAHFFRVQGRVTTLAGEEGIFAHLNGDGTFSLE